MATEKQKAFLQSYALENLSKPAVAAAQEPENLLGKVTEGSGKAFDTTMHVLDTGSREVSRPFLGALEKAGAALALPLTEMLGTDPQRAKDILAAPSFTAAYEMGSEDSPFGQRGALELLFDPSTYLGIGLFKKLGEALELAAKGMPEAGQVATEIYAKHPDAIKWVNQLAAVDEYLGRLQALPFTVTGKALKPVGKAVDELYRSRTGRSLMDLSPKGQVDTGKRSIRSLFSKYGEQDLISTFVNPERSEQADIADQELLDGLLGMRSRVRRKLLDQADRYQLARIYQRLQPIMADRALRTPEQMRTLKEIATEFGKRGDMMDAEGNLTPKFQAHAQLEDALLRAGMTSLQERTVAHGVLDIMADRLPAVTRLTKQERTFPKPKPKPQARQPLTPQQKIAESQANRAARAADRQAVADAKNEWRSPAKQAEILTKVDADTVKEADGLRDAELVIKSAELKLNDIQSRITSLTGSKNRARKVARKGTVSRQLQLAKTEEKKARQELTNAREAFKQAKQTHDAARKAAIAVHTTTAKADAAALAKHLGDAQGANRDADRLARMQESARQTKLRQQDRRLLREWTKAPTEARKVLVDLFKTPDDVYRRIDVRALLEPERMALTEESLKDLTIEQRRRVFDHGQRLNDLVQGVSRSATGLSAEKGGPETVYLTRLSDASSVVHELLGHVFARNMNDAQKARLLKSLGISQWTGKAEEALARGVERLIRTAEPNDFRVRDLFQQVQELSQEAPLPSSVFNAQGSEAFLRALVGDPLTDFSSDLAHPAVFDRYDKAVKAAGFADIGEARVTGASAYQRAHDPQWQMLPLDVQHGLTPPDQRMPAGFKPGFEPQAMGRATSDAQAGRAGVFTQGKADDPLAPHDLPVRTPLQALSELRIEASLEESLRRVATRAGLPPHIMAPIAKILDPMARQNAAYFSNLELYQNPEVEELLVEAALDPARAPELVNQALERLGATMGAFGGRHPWMQKFGDFLPERSLPIGTVKPSNSTGRLKRPTSRMLEQDHEKWMEVVNTGGVREKVQEYLTDIVRIEEIFRTVRQAHPLFKRSENLTWRDVTEAIEKGWVGEDDEELIDLLRKWDLPTKELEQTGGKLNKSHVNARQLKLQEAIVDAWEKETRKALGMKGPRQDVFSKSFHWLTSAWREQALLSVANFVANNLDMVVRSALHGINPFITEESAFRFAQDIGHENIPASLRPQMHAAFSLDDDASRSALGKIPILGRVLDPLVQFNWSLLNWQDSTGRMATWKHGASEYLTKEVKPRFMQEVKRRAKAQGMTDQALGSVTEELNKAGIRFNDRQVRDLIRTRGGSDALADELAQVWRQGTMEASAHGEKLALDIQLDFLDERELERVLHLRTWLPFHTWATRNIPFYLQTAVHNPWLVRAWYHYNQLTEEQQEQMGTTKSFQDKILAPDRAQAFLSLFLGPGTHFFNPLVVMSVTAQFKDPFLPDDAPATARALNLLGRVGIRPAPWIDLPLNVLGAYGDVEPFGLWRHGDAFAGITGIDAKPTVRLVNTLRQLFPWNARHETLSGSALKDYLINKQIRLLAISETGDADSPAYVAAMASPDSAIYQRAEELVRQEQTRRGLYSLLVPVPHARLDDQEREIRQVAPRGELSAAARATLRELDHPGAGLSGIPDDRRDAEIDAGFALTEGLPFDSPARTPVLQAFPAFADYLTWLKSRPKGAPRGVRDYLASPS